MPLFKPMAMATVQLAPLCARACECGLVDSIALAPLRRRERLGKFSSAAVPLLCIECKDTSRNSIKRRNPDPAVTQVFQALRQDSHSAPAVLDKYGHHLPLEGWMSLLDEIGKLNNWALAIDVFKWLQGRRWCRESENGLYSKLITIMGKQGQLRLASWLFSEMPKNGCRPHTSVYNAIIMAHLRCKNVEKALEKALSYFAEMKTKIYANPNVVTYNILTRACAQAGWIEKVEEFRAEMIDRELQPDIYTFNGIMDAYGKGGYYREMELMLQAMRDYRIRPDLITFNILIDAYGKGGDFAKMEQVYRSMINYSRERPSVSTFNSMLSSYGLSGNLKNMEQVLVRMDASGLGPDLGTFNALITSYGKAGEFDMMMSCFSKMTQSAVLPQVSTLNAILQVYIDHGMLEEAEALFVNCCKINLKPDISSYLILFKAYGEECQLEKMTAMMKKMEQSGLKSGEEFLLSALESYAAWGSPENHSSSSDKRPHDLKERFDNFTGSKPGTSTDITY